MPNTILIIDDDSSVRSVFETILSQDGYRVYSVSSIDDAAKLVASCRIGVYLIDVGLSGERGDDFAIKTEFDCSVPIIVTGQNVNDDFVADMLDHGVLFVLQKPICQKLLRASVRAAMRIHEIMEQQNRAVKTIEELEGLLKGLTSHEGE